MCKYDPSKAKLEKIPAFLKEVIDHLPPVMFEHIVRCLNKHPDYEKDDEFRPNGSDKNLYHYGFYLIAYPTKTYHYASVDRGRLIFTEYFKYNKSGVLKSDTIFVEDAVGDIAKLASNYNRELTGLLSKFRPKLTREDIMLVIEMYLDNPKIRSEVDRLNDQLAITGEFSNDASWEAQKAAFFMHDRTGL